MLVEPVDRPADGIYLVFALHEAVAFIRVIVSVNGLTGAIQDLNNLLRLFFRDPNVVVALQNQEGSASVADIRDG